MAVVRTGQQFCYSTPYFTGLIFSSKKETSLFLASVMIVKEIRQLITTRYLTSIMTRYSVGTEMWRMFMKDDQLLTLTIKCAT